MGLVRAVGHCGSFFKEQRNNALHGKLTGGSSQHDALTAKAIHLYTAAYFVEFAKGCTTSWKFPLFIREQQASI